MMVSISSTRIAIMIAILIVKSTTTARELRPSAHGLEYQGSTPPSTTSQEMKSFFKGSSSSMSSPSSTSDNNFALPRAMNSTDTSWWSDGGGGGRDRVRHVMLIASVVCGATGVSLLAAAAFIYFLRYRTRKPSPSSLSLVHDNTNNAK